MNETPPETPTPPAPGRRPNHLTGAKSPYLLQHAYNPVEWYPWGDEAFEKARREDKPIFLSIGYSTCHWCQVMAHESFEDPQVARLMNETFVSIKVDREERPDVDGVYMTVCQALTGSGGWPLTIIMTPDRRPFFAATYIPKRGRFGRMGLLEIVPRVAALWKNDRKRLLGHADNITRILGEAATHAPGDALGAEVLDAAFKQLSDAFDAEHGGFGEAPKFPTPHNLLFLLRYGRRTGNARAGQMAERTLQAMRRGGLYDHVGFGFHRYATDARWFAPHFEKMLYDQALLAVAYLEAYQATGRQAYARTADEVLAYVLRDLTSPEGAFYSAQDADSEGVEGKFYVWTWSEVHDALSPEEASFAVKVFHLEKDGNYRDEATRRPTGANILYSGAADEDLAASLGVTAAEFHRRLEVVRRKLFAVRARRVPPHRDDKVLADWNGLMIGALARAARVLHEPRYARAASRAVAFVQRRMRRPDGRLFHRFRAGHAAVDGFLDDYAFLAWGLIELYQATFDAQHLEEALRLKDLLLEHFWDAKDGGFFFVADDAEQMLFRRKETFDGATPSGNSVAMLALIQLARMTGDADLEKRADALGRAFSRTVRAAPRGHTQMLLAVDFALGPSFEIVVAGAPRAADTRALLRAVREPYVPNKVVLLRPTDRQAPPITRLAPFTRYYTAVEGRAAAYVCRNFLCAFPATDPAQVKNLLKNPQN